MQVLRWGIVSASFIYLLLRLRSSEPDNFRQLFSYLSDQWGYFLLIVLLMVLNWYLESIKWQLAIRSRVHLSAKQAFASVLAGTGVSLFTPNRSGEFLGRWFWLEESERPYAIPASIVGSMSQLFITLLAGSWVWTVQKPTTGDLSGAWMAAFFLSMVLMGLIFLLVFRIHLLLPWVRLYLERKQLLPYVQFVMSMPVSVKWKIFGWSALRYAVFSFQFAFLLQLFTDQPFYVFLPALSKVYFVQTLIPSFAFSELGIRGTAALAFLGTQASAEALILATGLIWTLNLLLPGIAGTLLLAFKKP